MNLLLNRSGATLTLYLDDIPLTVKFAWANFRLPILISSVSWFRLLLLHQVVYTASLWQGCGNTSNLKAMMVLLSISRLACMLEVRNLLSLSLSLSFSFSSALLSHFSPISLNILPSVIIIPITNGLCIAVIVNSG